MRYLTRAANFVLYPFHVAIVIMIAAYVTADVLLEQEERLGQRSLLAERRRAKQIGRLRHGTRRWRRTGMPRRGTTSDP